jgi:thimet oligopeptidase
MRWKFLPFLAFASMVAGCRPEAFPSKAVSFEDFMNQPPAIALNDLQKFISRTAEFNSTIAVPIFETSTNQINASVEKAIADGNAALDRVGKLTASEVNFTNTARALDDLGSELSYTDNRLSLIQQTSTNSEIRDGATEALKTLEQWMVKIDYREDVYRAMKAYADTKPALEGEDAKLLAETMRDYRRAGLDLPKADRDEVERLQTELVSVSVDFEKNIEDAKAPMKFTKAELEGLPDDFLKEKKTGDDEYTVMANVTVDYLRILDNAKREDTRKRITIAQCNLAREQNIPLLQKVLVLRDNIARKLGYKTYEDYDTETKMAKNAATAISFEEKLTTGLQPKLDAELEQFRKMKVQDTGDANAKINIWDWRYYANQLKIQKYNVDAEQLRVYFPYQHVLDGMFAIYQHIFGLKFERVDPPYKWIGDLQLYAVSDAKTGEPLGMFYLDMFPRDGKYHHFAQFGIMEGKLLPDGKYQRPVCALICNFPKPTPDHPALMTHDDVETIFHEFGHAMHTILTRAKYSRFSGTSVPRDFVEAPSQMLENWAWDKKVLDSFAADYRDPSKKIPADILAQLKEARLATEGAFYRRQLSFGMMDLALHTQIHADNQQDTLPLSNKVLGEVFLPMPPDTAFVAYFGHIIGYGAGYYGYAWADAIAADMATVFEKSPDGYFDVQAGMRLRKEIYEVGDSRDVNISIEKFLGRPRSLEPFLKKIGINKPVEDKK